MENVWIRSYTWTVLAISVGATIMNTSTLNSIPTIRVHNLVVLFEICLTLKNMNQFFDNENVPYNPYFMY